MKHEDIVRIARENGIDWFRIPGVDQVLFEKFAVALVEAEREAILKLTDSLGWIDSAAIRAREET